MKSDHNHIEEKLRKERKKKRKVTKSSGTLAGQIQRTRTSKGFKKRKG